MSGGFARIIAHLADKVITERLAQSPAFQRFAYRTVEGAKGIKNAAVQKGAETASKAKARVTEQGAQAKQSVGENAGSFFQAMKEEAMKDFQKIAGKK